MVSDWSSLVPSKKAGGGAFANGGVERKLELAVGGWVGEWVGKEIRWWHSLYIGKVNRFVCT